MFGPDKKASARHALRSLTASTALPCTLSTTTSRWSGLTRPHCRASGLQAPHEWMFTWASSLDSDFNYDFNTSFTEEQECSGNMDHNYHMGGITSGSEAGPEASQDRASNMIWRRRRKVFAEMTGTDIPTYTREAPGMSAFALSDGVVYHTYSAYARGLDALWGIYQWVYRAPKGRNETGPWFRGMNQDTRDSR